MSCVNILKNALQKTTNSFLTSATIFTEQTRSTAILKRRYPLPLCKPNAQPRMKHRHYIYDLVENTSIKKRKPIDIVLTSYVTGKGEKGTKLSLDPMIAYNKFLLMGLAVYATPENITKYTLTEEEKAETKWSSPYVSQTLSGLRKAIVSVPMSYEVPWTLEVWHIRSAFRCAGIYVNDDCITMPEKPISGPNIQIEDKIFTVTVTINKRESVKVRCRINHWSNDPLNPVKKPSK